MKKGLLIVGAVAIVIATVPMFAAYEAHVINVTAHIENALKVLPGSGELEFGTVFPQEYREKTISITTSSSFCQETQRRVLSIDYKIVQKPKCECDGEFENSEQCPDGQFAPVGFATHKCPAGYTAMPSLCPYLSKTPQQIDEAPFTDFGVPAFHDPDDPANVATGTINKDFDLVDNWTIDLAVPCFEGHCAQDWDEFVASHNSEANPDDYILPFELEGKDFGCDLWVEVTDIYDPELSLVQAAAFAAEGGYSCGS